MDTTIQTTIFGWPLFLIFASVFLLNFLIARYMTIRLLQKKYIKKGSPEFKKAVIAWFMPIVGALGLWMLLWTHHVIAFWKSISKKLFLNHV